MLCLSQRYLLFLVFQVGIKSGSVRLGPLLQSFRRYALFQRFVALELLYLPRRPRLCVSQFGQVVEGCLEASRASRFYDRFVLFEVLAVIGFFAVLIVTAEICIFPSRGLVAPVAEGHDTHTHDIGLMFDERLLVSRLYNFADVGRNSKLFRLIKERRDFYVCRSLSH